MAAPMAFARKGSALLRRVLRLHRVTRGRFDGEAAVLLETTRLYVEAAANGFLAAAGNQGLSEAQRAMAGGIAHAFRRALGVLATHLPGHDTVPGLGDLAGPGLGKLAQRFVAGAPVVTVSAAARDAIDTLRRDPLALADYPLASLRALMAAAAEGTELSAP